MKALPAYLLLLVVVPVSAEPFIETLIEPENPWVQQQVRYTLRLYRDSHLQQGDFLPPEVPDVLLRHAGSSEPRPVIRDGREMELVEERWLLFPQRSGPLILPAPVFSGRDFYLKGKPSRLSVRPRPADSGDFPWLVTGELVLTQTWDGGLASLRAGDRRLRRVRVRARDVTGAQLPPLPLPELDHFEVYRLPPRITERFDDAGMLWGERLETFLFVAREAGKGRIPGVELRWWDPERKSVQKKQLAATDYRVMAGTAGAPAATGPGTAHRSPSAAGQWFDIRRYAWLSLLPAVLLLWWLVRLLPAERIWKMSWGQLRLLWACLLNRPRPALAALQYLADGKSPFHPAIMAREPELREALRRLDNAVYGPPGRHCWSGRADWKLLRKVPGFVTHRRVHREKTILPPLWRYSRSG